MAQITWCALCWPLQSVALRLVCDREAEIEALKRVTYWSIEAKS